jgi:hypothetical protein
VAPAGAADEPARPPRRRPRSCSCAPVQRGDLERPPGPSEPLYWNGPGSPGTYPISILVDGQALNITTSSYAGNLDFGILGCRRTVPSLQRVLTYLEDELRGLEAA